MVDIKLQNLISCRPSFVYVCAHCGKEAPKMKRCAKCLVSAYCSRECQVAAWPSHKKNCEEIAKSSGIYGAFRRSEIPYVDLTFDWHPDAILLYCMNPKIIINGLDICREGGMILYQKDDESPVEGFAYRDTCAEYSDAMDKLRSSAFIFTIDVELIYEMKVLLKIGIDAYTIEYTCSHGILHCFRTMKKDTFIKALSAYLTAARNRVKIVQLNVEVVPHKVVPIIETMLG